MTTNKDIFAIRTKIRPLPREIEALKFGRKWYMNYQEEIGSIIVAMATICLVILLFVLGQGISLTGIPPAPMHPRQSIV